MSINDLVEYHIRRALPEDAYGIHTAHMQSIREVCSDHHSQDEIKGWGYRPFNEEMLVDKINKQMVYVVEIENHIEGFVHFHFVENVPEVYIDALYLTRKTIGQGVGRKLMKIIEEECSKNGIQKITLHSTITAHEFYKKMGFIDSGEMTRVQVNGVKVRCTPMHKIVECHQM